MQPRYCCPSRRGEARGIDVVFSCRKYYFNVMWGTDMFAQWPGYLGHEELGDDWSHIGVYPYYRLL